MILSEHVRRLVVEWSAHAAGCGLCRTGECPRGAQFGEQHRQARRATRQGTKESHR